MVWVFRSVKHVSKLIFDRNYFDSLCLQHILLHFCAQQNMSFSTTCVLHSFLETLQFVANWSIILYASYSIRVIAWVYTKLQTWKTAHSVFGVYMHSFIMYNYYHNWAYLIELMNKTAKTSPFLCSDSDYYWHWDYRNFTVLLCLMWITSQRSEMKKLRGKI